jgi:hypothetical protein
MRRAVNAERNSTSICCDSSQFGAEVHLFFDDGIASACLSRKRSTPCFCAKVSKASDHLFGQRHDRRSERPAPSAPLEHLNEARHSTRARTRRSSPFDISAKIRRQRRNRRRARASRRHDRALWAILDVIAHPSRCSPIAVHPTALRSEFVWLDHACSRSVLRDAHIEDALGLARPDAWLSLCEHGFAGMSEAIIAAAQLAPIVLHRRSHPAAELALLFGALTKETALALAPLFIAAMEVDPPKPRLQARPTRR